SVKHLAEACSMSDRQVQKCKVKLTERYDKIGKMPLIKITSRKKDNGSADTDLIEIVPIWRINGDYFRKGGGERDAPGVVNVVHQGGECGAPKEEHIKKNPKEELLCPPSGPETSSVIQKTDFQGRQFVITKSDIFAYAIKTKRDWKAEEIESAWIILNNADKIADPYEFIAGVINKIRAKEYTKKMN